jgi:endonuclease I
MKRIFITMLLPFCAVAQIPEYYNTVNFDLSGNALKNELADLITDTHTNELVYTPEVWTALKQADLDPENPENVLLIYGYNDTDDDPDNDRTRDKDFSCHTTSCEGLWVREHVYPRSLGNPNLEFDGPGSDAHHLRAIDYYMNNMRSNKRFTEGSGNAAVVNGSYFYPGDEWKGDIARMMMYMYVRYQSRCLAVVVGFDDATYNMDMPDIFLEWNAEDPVSAYELNRNTVLQEMQGNRNPFIDNPHLATQIWGGPEAENPWALHTENFNDKKVIIYPTVTSGTIYIDSTIGNNYEYEVYNMVGQKIQSGVATNSVNISGNTKGIYILNINSGNITQSHKIILN